MIEKPEIKDVNWTVGSLNDLLREAEKKAVRVEEHGRVSFDVYSTSECPLGAHLYATYYVVGDEYSVLRKIAADHIATHRGRVECLN